MSHTSNLLMNTIREALEKLAKSGVGYIYGEMTTSTFYRIDDKCFRVLIAEMSREAVE